MKFIISDHSLQCPCSIIFIYIRVVDHIDHISSRLLLKEPVPVGKQKSVHRLPRLRHEIQLYDIPVLSENSRIPDHQTFLREQRFFISLSERLQVL